MKKPLISVVIPVYNVESYLENCINSIVQQTYSNLEIILVNDGSTDNSTKICETAASKDSRIVLINQKNQGVSSARNNGLSIARGEWIYFIDADDFLNLDTFELLSK